MDGLEAIKATFFQECEELLGDLEAGLLAIEGGDEDPETINAVFRAVHSVKGGAGAFALEDLVRFAHVFETLLDELRSGRLASSPEIVRTLLRAADMLADHVKAAQGQGPADAARSAALVAELEAHTAGDGAPAPAAAPEPEFAPVGFKPVVFSLDEPEAPAASTGPKGWTIRFTPAASLYANGNEAGLILRELERLGPLAVELDDSAAPRLEDLSPEAAWLIWHATLSADVDEAAVREAFEFVQGDCEVEIQPIAGDAPAPSGDLDALLASLTATAAPPPPEPELDVAALIARVSEPAPAPSPAPASAAPTAPAEKAAASATPAAGSAAPTIRVDLDRVDRLINLVGELVIQQAMLSQKVTDSGLARSSDMGVGLDELEQLTREIQDSVMAIRAQPVKSVFQRMPRLVREVAEMTGKRVRLVTEGENTEVDRTVIERISDPITHMLRNAIDHGLEKPEKREAAGKSGEGQVRLAALHRSGRIVIEVEDDGAGINRERVKSIAVDKGLIPADAALSDEEIDNLIFLPGFSTADTISDVSGRGVGMDVVKRSIQGLGGRISISSRPGLGSKFTMSLPLTLAVLDGMVVTAGDQTLVAPVSAVVESMKPRPGDVRNVGAQDSVIMVRDQFVPLIDVGLALGFRDTPTPAETGVAMLVESDDGGRAALLVEGILGQRQVVIKGLEANYQRVPGVSAATILGDGRVALILDVDELVASLRRRASRPAETRIPVGAI